MFASKDLFLTRPSGYQISRSVRLRYSASAYFSRTPASAGNQKTWTWSGWVKRGSLGVLCTLFASRVSNNDSQAAAIYIGSDDKIAVLPWSNSFFISNAVLRDPSAWYHIVVAFDTTQATATNRVKVYINSVNQAGTYPLAITQNANYAINQAGDHRLGDFPASGFSTFDGYITEVNFIDGQALTPSSFGETNSVTGVWQPKKYGGTYGTNGFYLNFSDNSNNTATTIGKDYSGNGNNWTPNNISVTAGVTYDSMLDVPTLYADGGNGRGNYAVLNPVDLGYNATTSEANLKVSTASAGNAASASTMALSTNTYWEVTIGSNSQVGLIWGRASDAYGNSSISMFASGAAGSLGNATRTLSATPSWSNGDTLGFAWNNSTRVLTLYQAGSATAVMTMTTPATGDPNVAITNYTSGAVMSSQVNFGQQPFTYTPPTGFVALNTQNLPTPTISNGATVMAASTYTGTGSAMSVSNAVNNVSFQPDWVWIKQRNNIANHVLADAIRGVNKYVFSNLTNAEATATAGTGITAFNSNGFSLGTETSTVGSVNAAGGTGTYVAWQWNAGGSTVTNTSGSISAQVRANATAGFSVVTYTGTGANATVGHGLGVAPTMMIVKGRNPTAAQSWRVYHKNANASPATGVLNLDQTTAFVTSSTQWNNTVPTSSVFTVGTDPAVNENTKNYVAYCFAAVAGYSAFGSYTGNGSADGPFVFTNFRPRWVMIKRTDAISNWTLRDTSRDASNISINDLYSNLSNAESSLGANIDILSNGFKCRDAGGSATNASGGTYIYACFAENPFKNSLAR